ncbi:MAG: type II toxin-antitoxin system VapC family toxin [Proteobacteria bacterium]|nr:type II toxin-antitoxin system VapC family toxin [Pseudomonadota bacterium]
MSSCGRWKKPAGTRALRRTSKRCSTRSNKAIYPVIFVDSNVPMYLVGAPHPNKEHLHRLLDELIRSRSRFVTDVEVYQEILHRSMAINRPDMIDPGFACLDSITGEILTIDMTQTRAARAIQATVDGFSAQGALHVAVMRTAGVSRILDRGFDACPGIERMK